MSHYKCQETLDTCRGRGDTGEPRICARQMVSSQRQPRALFVLQHLAAGSLNHAAVFSRGLCFVFSNRFSPNGFDLFTKGKISSLAVHNGISLGKSDEEECVSGTLTKAHNWQNEMLFSVGRRTHTRTHTQKPLFSAYLSLTYAHCSTYFANDQTSTSLSLNVCVC